MPATLSLSLPNCSPETRTPSITGDTRAGGAELRRAGQIPLHRGSSPPPVESGGGMLAPHASPSLSTQLPRQAPHSTGAPVLRDPQVPHERRDEFWGLGSTAQLGLSDGSLGAPSTLGPSPPAPGHPGPCLLWHHPLWPVPCLLLSLVRSRRHQQQLRVLTAVSLLSRSELPQERFSCLLCSPPGAPLPTAWNTHAHISLRQA